MSPTFVKSDSLFGIPFVDISKIISFLTKMVAVHAMLLLWLCAFCTGQIAPPIMSNTFQGSGEVEFHGAVNTVFGECKLQNKNAHDLVTGCHTVFVISHSSTRPGQGDGV